MNIIVLVRKPDYEEFISGLENGFEIISNVEVGENYKDQYRIELKKKEVSRKSPGRKFKFTDTQVEAMRQMKDGGASLREIATRMNVSPQTIANYLNPEKREKTMGQEKK